MALVFMSFIELVLEGGWNEESVFPESKTPRTVPDPRVVNARKFWANGRAEIKVVEPEVVIRRFILGPNARIYVANSVVSFKVEDIEDELTVDEEQRAGKRLKLAD